MTLAPLLAAPPAVQLHAVSALGALALGLWQMLAAKGTAAHRMAGFAWVVLMGAVALSSFAITGTRGPGRLSWIHALSAFTLLMLPVAVLHARRGRLRSHRISMLALFFGALIVTGAFTLLPGRLMGRVVFG